MKPISKTEFGALPALVLDATDLHELLTLFSATCKEVTMSDGRFEYESLDELLQNCGGHLPRLAIRGRSPYVSLEFNRSDFPKCIFLFASEGDDSAHALYLRLLAFLRDRRRWYVRLLPWPVLYVLTGISIALSAASLSSAFTARLGPHVAQAVSATPLVVWFVFILGLLGQQGVTYVIRPGTRRQRFQRSSDLRDKIVLALLSALVGGVIGAVIHAYSAR